MLAGQDIALRKTAARQSASRDVVPPNTHTSAVETTHTATPSDTIEVCWLPSVPLTQKHKAPPISGLGILYSEAMESVLQVFETDNLSEGITGFSQDQAAALSIDPACRLCWIEITNPAHRSIIKMTLMTQISSIS